LKSFLPKADPPVAEKTLRSARNVKSLKIGREERTYHGGTEEDERGRKRRGSRLG
jgi:hypothetical protein